MRHARTGAVQAAVPVLLEDLLEPSAVPAVEPHAPLAPMVEVEPTSGVVPVLEPLLAEAVPSKADPRLEAWSWPEAPGLPPTPSLMRGIPVNAPPPRSHARVLPAADQPRRSLPRLRSFRGPSPAERYGLPPAARPAEPGGEPNRARGPLVGLLAAVVVGASWVVVAGLVGYSLGVLAVVLGAAVGAVTRHFGRSDGDENVFFAVLWSILGAAAGFLVIAVRASMAALGVGAGTAIEGARWDEIVRGVATAPLNWLYVVLGVAAALFLVRRPGRG